MSRRAPAGGKEGKYAETPLNGRARRWSGGTHAKVGSWPGTVSIPSSKNHKKTRGWLRVAIVPAQFVPRQAQKTGGIRMMTENGIDWQWLLEAIREGESQRVFMALTNPAQVAVVGVTGAILAATAVKAAVMGAKRLRRRIA